MAHDNQTKAVTRREARHRLQIDVALNYVEVGHCI